MCDSFYKVKGGYLGFAGRSGIGGDRIRHGTGGVNTSSIVQKRAKFTHLFEKYFAMFMQCIAFSIRDIVASSENIVYRDIEKQLKGIYNIT